MTRLKKIRVEGFRGARYPLDLDFTKNNASMAIYGDNGGGKSTVTDAIEWFYTDRVDHLWREDCKEECLRNTHFSDDKDATVSIELSNTALSVEKSLTPLFRAKFSNTSQDLKDYLEQSKKERLFLRYDDMLRFIILTKGKKRSEVLNIIGYHRVDEIRATLVSACNDIERDPHFREVRNRLARNEASQIEQVGHVISTQTELYETANNILKPLKLGIDVVHGDSLNKAIEALKTQSGLERERLERSSKLSTFQESLSNLKQEIGNTEELDQFLKTYAKIIKDKEKIKKIGMIQLLEKGKEAIQGQLAGIDICPLCLSTINASKVIQEVEERVQELETISKEIEEAQTNKASALINLRRIKKSFDDVEQERIEGDPDFDKIRDIAARLRDSIEQIIADVETKFTRMEPIEKEPQIFVKDFSTVSNEVDRLIPIAKSKISAFAQSKEQKLRIEIFDKVSTLEKTFREHKKLSKELDIFERQLGTLTTIRDDFVKTQANVLQKVLQAISGDIDTFYRKINPDEGVENIRLDIVGDEGVEFKYVFHGKESHPPLKYLSESHLNCLGICLFLASVRLFNKQNKFLILDDVITSFDKNHRIPFLRLLQDHFSDYQVLLFTHERFWYEIINAEMRQFGWSFNDVSWSIEDGIQLKKSIVDLKERIDHKLNQGNLDVGNDLRKLLEQILKEICFSVEAKMRFRFNHDNEQRMTGELLNALRSKLNKEKCDARDDRIFKRLATSSLVTSRTSHDSPPFESRGDIDQIRKDIEEFESLFVCPNCRKYVSIEYADKAGKLIKCKCGTKSLKWAFA